LTHLSQSIMDADLLANTERFSLGDDDEVQRLKRENESLRSKIVQLQSNDAVSINAGRANLEIPFEDLEMDQQIGGGGFSLVYRAMYKGTPVAVKRWFNPDCTDAVMQEFREEVLTLRELRHPHVVQFIGACMRPPNLCIVLEYLPYSLFQVVHGGQFDVDRRRVMALSIDICRAFQYLHSRSPPVVHRDIKPGNFLVDRAWKVKLCDFGLASINERQKGAGTPGYMAPELHANRPYNEKVDVYAFGIMLWEMLAKQVPFDGAGPAEIRRRVLDGERPEMPLSCPKALAKLIRECWDQDSDKRPSFASIQKQLKSMD